jgi:hypothetical protein
MRGDMGAAGGPQAQGAKLRQSQESGHQQLLGSALPSEASLRGQLATGQGNAGDAQAVPLTPTVQLHTAASHRAAPTLATADAELAAPDNTLATTPILSTAANTIVAARSSLSRPPLRGCSPAQPRLEVRRDGALRAALHRREPAASRERMLRLFSPAGSPPVGGSVDRAALLPPVAAVQQAAAALRMGRQAGGTHMRLLPWEALAWEQTGGPLACLAGCRDD